MVVKPKGISKENFRLLDLSSEDDSEDLQLEIIPSRKKKVTRRERSKITSPQTVEPNVRAEVQCALCWAVRGTLVLWLLMLTWICAALYDQFASMQMDIAKVSTRSDSVGDTIQTCHTAVQELRGNATLLKDRLTALETQYLELAKKVDSAVNEIGDVSKQLAASPKLIDTPRRVAQLEMTVADIGSQMKGFDSTLSTTKTQASTAAAGVDEVKNLLHDLEARSNETIANVSASVKREDELKELITELNTSVMYKVQALEQTIEEISKSKIAAAAVPAKTSLSADLPQASSTTSSTSLKPITPEQVTSGPSVKLNVTQ